MKQIQFLIAFIFFTFATGVGFAAEQPPSGMMDNCEMMEGGSMWFGMGLMVLLFIALILAIMSLSKYLFFDKK